MYINSVEAAQYGNKTVPFFCQNKLLDGRVYTMIDTHINALSIPLYPYLPYFEIMASIIVPILTKSEYLVSLYMVITTRSRITNKNRIYVSEEYIL